MLIWVKMDKQQQSDNTVILTDIGKQKIIVKNKILTETYFNKSLMVLQLKVTKMIYPLIILWWNKTISIPGPELN